MFIFNINSTQYTNILFILHWHGFFISSRGDSFHLNPTASRR